MGKLKGKWALVTGSARGIGQQIALGLASQNCNVVIHGRHLDHTRKTQQLLGNTGVKVACVAGELDTREGVEAVIQAVRDQTDRVDVLYNNAAINNNPTPIFDFSPEDWWHTFQVNLFAMTQLCAAFAPGMRTRKWGRIVNLTSGIAGQPRLAPYSASKAAVDKYTEDLAAEFDGENVLVNRVDPGWIRTDLGGADAWESVESVVPGVLVPALLPDHGASGRFYHAQDFKSLRL